MVKVAVQAQPDEPKQKKEKAKKQLKALRQQLNGSGNLGNSQIKDILKIIIDMLTDETSVD